MPRIVQVLTSVRSRHRASSISPGRGLACRTATASAADEATCACTPHSRRAIATASAPPAGSTNCRLSLQASTCAQVVSAATPHFYTPGTTSRPPRGRSRGFSASAISGLELSLPERTEGSGGSRGVPQNRRESGRAAGGTRRLDGRLGVRRERGGTPGDAQAQNGHSGSPCDTGAPRREVRQGLRPVRVRRLKAAHRTARRSGADPLRGRRTAAPALLRRARAGGGR